MRFKVLTCQTLPYYHGKREEHWINAFKNEIDNNQDISEVLKDENSQAEYSLNRHYVNLLLYAIANKKTISTNSIFNYINWSDNHNKRFLKYIFSFCGIYFASDKYQRDACRIITFMKEKNILKVFLKEYLNDKLSEKLSSKNEEINKYLYDNEVIFSALLKKHKISARKFNFIMTCPISLILTLLVSMISLPIGHIIYPDLSILEIFTRPLVIFSLCATLSLLFVGIAGSIWMYHAENNIPVEKMQQKLDDEQNSHCTASSEDMEAEEQAPSTVLEIHLPPEARYSNTSVGDGLAKGFVSGMNAASVWW